MKNNQLQIAMGQETTTIATCWQLTLKNGLTHGFTNHNNELIIEEISYRASSGFTPTAIENNERLAVDNLEVEAILDNHIIKEKDILAGLYDFAKVIIFKIDYNNINGSKFILKKGWLGEIKLMNNKFIAEIRGISQSFSQNIGDLYSPCCRANFADEKCKIDLNKFMFSGTINKVLDNRTFLDHTLDQEDGFFNFGKIIFIGGLNNMLETEVKHYFARQITMALAPPYPINPGDNYQLIAGCDKTHDTCSKKFNNMINFRGEPHVPGINKILNTLN